MKIFVLPTQEDIVQFEQGQRPGNVLEHNFSTEMEQRAYEDGVNVVEDEFDEIIGLRREGLTVYFNHAVDVGENSDGEDIPEEEVTFNTEGEAEAYRQGIDDAEGFHSPRVIKSDDPSFARLAALVAVA